jgi:hypothetical protein
MDTSGVATVIKGLKMTRRSSTRWGRCAAYGMIILIAMEVQTEFRFPMFCISTTARAPSFGWLAIPSCADGTRFC